MKLKTAKHLLKTCKICGNCLSTIVLHEYKVCTVNSYSLTSAEIQGLTL